jgi:KUP system potassium uptake protein
VHDLKKQQDGKPQIRGSLGRLGLAALGVVFGDIATSPLYTFKTVLDVTGAHPNAAAVLGSVSLIIWTLIVITTIKYVTLAMRIDNDGEGGILALMSLLTGASKRHRPIIIAVGLFGAALIYGDGAITPAISVLSAVEGLEIVQPSFANIVLPLSVAILVALFAIQSQGTAKIGGAFGPIMLAWLIVIGALGVWGIARHPQVLVALDPRLGLSYLVSGGSTGFLVLGGVFLCVTGAEALYADMGHFGPTPIRAAWMTIVFPALVLNYAGQAAIVLSGGTTEGNIFYRLCPPAFLLPLVLLATAATIIASQAIITGAFSMTRQAIQLGWLPRLQITQTSAEGLGQIYVAPVNWLLMVATLALTIGFRKSDNLASAYGVAVSATMLLTSILLFIAVREVWKWRLTTALLVIAPLAVVDLAFLSANLLKIASGGYIPLLLASAIYGLMAIWHRGVEEVARRIRASVEPIPVFLTRIAEANIPRVPGTAVYLTRAQENVPPVMTWYVRHARSLHENVIAMTVTSLSVPWSKASERFMIEKVAPGFWRATARYGYMERPDIPNLLRWAEAGGSDLDLADVTYFIGHETVIPRERLMGLPLWIEASFAFMQRNAAHVTEYFRVPHDRVIEIGREIAI